jgi:hypothetical protein
VTAFQRAYHLNIGSIDIDASRGVALNALRVVFSVTRDVKRHPNSCEVRIYNLTRTHQAALAQAPEVRVRLEAGYVGDLGTIFDGDLRSARSLRQGTDVVTSVSGGDGATKIRTARINKTFTAGTPVATVIAELGKALGVGAGNLKDFAGAQLRSGSKTLTRPLTLHGPVFDELEHVTRSCGLRWSVQDSALQLREAGLPVGDRQGPLLRSDTGLIGQVEVETVVAGAEKAKGVVKTNKALQAQGFGAGTTKVTGVCLLRPDLIPGVPFRVESEAFTGNLVCTGTVHSGDSHSTDQWSVEWTGRPYQ